MIKDFGFSLSEIDNMIPFEKEVYLMLIKDDLEEKAKLAKQGL
jgi:hypothetical protein